MEESKEWGLGDDSEDGISFQNLSPEEETNDDDEEENDGAGRENDGAEEAVKNVAENAGEKLAKRLADKSISDDDQDILTNWARDSKKQRYGVTLRRRILEGTVDEIDPSKLRDSINSVIDVELLDEALEETSSSKLEEIFRDRIEELGDRSTDHLILDGEYRYFPVFGFNINHVCTVPYRDADADDYEFDSIFIGDKLLSWWEGDSITPRHPYLLLNPIDSTKNTNHTADGVPFREIFRLPKGEQLSFSDSGGFQMVSREDAKRVDTAEEHDWQNAILHPETVLDWQIDNADAGAILDHPPYVTEGESSIFSAEDDNLSEWIDDPFLTFLNRTRENAESMHAHLEKRKENGDMRAQDYEMFGVIQGHSFNEHAVVGDEEPVCLQEDDYNTGERPHWYMLEKWHGEIEQVRDWNAWALSPTPCTSPGQIALHLSYAHNNCENADWFHVLQVGSAINIAVIQYYAMISDKFVSSDASSHNRGSKYRQYMMSPGYGRSRTITNRDNVDFGNDFDTYPCNCKVCETVEKEHGFEYISDGADSKRNATINLHNLTVQILAQKITNSTMRAEGPEGIIAGLKMTNDGEISKVYSDFWKNMKSLTTKSKIRQIYNAMVYTYCSCSNGMQSSHDLWIKENKYREVEYDADEEDVSGEGHFDILEPDEKKMGSRSNVEEDEEDEEERELTEDEKQYIPLPLVKLEKPEEKNEEYYYKRTVQPQIPGQEMSMDPCEDATDW